MESRWARVARGWTAAAFAIVAAAVSHTLAGGSAPTPFALMVSLIIAGAVCTALTGRRLSRVRLAASVALSQALFHGLFSALGTPVSARHQMGSMAMDVTTGDHGAATMWLGHAAAALVTIVVFTYAESAFWGLATTARLFFARLLALTSSLPPRTVGGERPVDLAWEPIALTRLLSPMRHRGPPAAVCA